MVFVYPSTAAEKAIRIPFYTIQILSASLLSILLLISTRRKKRDTQHFSTYVLLSFSPSSSLSMLTFFLLSLAHHRSHHRLSPPLCDHGSRRRALRCGGSLLYSFRDLRCELTSPLSSLPHFVPAFETDSSVLDPFYRSSPRWAPSLRSFSE